MRNRPSRNQALVIAFVAGELAAGGSNLLLQVVGVPWLAATGGGVVVGVVVMAVVRIRLTARSGPDFVMEGIAAPTVDAVDLKAIHWKQPKLRRGDRLVEVMICRPTEHRQDKMVVILKRSRRMVLGYDKPIIITPFCHMHSNDAAVADEDLPPLRTTTEGPS